MPAQTKPQERLAMKVAIPCPALPGTPSACAGHRPALPAELVFREFGLHTVQLNTLPNVFDMFSVVICSGTGSRAWIGNPTTRSDRDGTCHRSTSSWRAALQKHYELQYDSCLLSLRMLGIALHKTTRTFWIRYAIRYIADL